jgi:hypothetical protein
MDDLRLRFATLDSVPTPVDWAEIERRAAAIAEAGAAPTGIGPMRVQRASGSYLRPVPHRTRGLALLVAAATVIAVLSGAIGIGGLLTSQNAIFIASPSPTNQTTPNPTVEPTTAPSPSITATPTAVAANCPGLAAPQQVRITKLNLPGKTTSPLGAPLALGCAIWVTSGENGGGIHRYDLATKALTNANPAEIVWDLDATGGELWAIGTTKAENGTTVLFKLDPATGATLRAVPLDVSGAPIELRIVNGRAWVGAGFGRLKVFDLERGELIATVDVPGRGFEVGAGGVWAGLSYVDPDTFEVSEVQTQLPASRIQVVGNSVYGITDQGEIARIDPATGRVLTAVQIDNWSGGLVAVERASIWVLPLKPETLPLKPVTTELLRVDATTGRIADRIPLDVIAPDSLSATEGNLWLVDQPSRIRHGFIQIELPATK